MAKGTDFGGIHSHRDLRLIEQLVDVQPAEPKLNMIDVPGADGSKDLTEQPAGRVVYKDRHIKWTYALYPGENWNGKHRQVSNALNGKRCRITLHDDPAYYYVGRLTVKKYKTDKALRQISIEATCSPYMLKQEVTTRTEAIGTEYTSIILNNDRKPVVPTITVDVETVLLWNGATYTINAGEHKLLNVELQEGDNNLLAKTTDGAGTITLTYQEGAL